MKYLISLNYKFFNKTPLELYNLTNDFVDGYEVYLRNSKDFEYLKEFSKIASNKIINFHGNIEENILNQKKFLDFIGVNLKDTNVVLHTKTDINVNNSIIKTISILKELLQYIKEKKYKITLSLENLNSFALVRRLNKNKLIPILEEIKDLYFTYDMGHEIIEKGKLDDLDLIHLERINNVHLHTYKGLIDHEFIYSTNQELKKIYFYLNKIKFNKTIVFEYDFYRARGDTYEEKIKDYIKSIIFVKEEIESVRKI